LTVASEKNPAPVLRETNADRPIIALATFRWLNNR
jgi:hypothetical protein